MYVIFKEFGVLKCTTKDNYHARIRDSTKVQRFENFDTAEEVKDYLTRHTKVSADKFVII